MEETKLNGMRTGKKIRKLYHLDSEDVQFVREYAQKKGVSESAVIRISVRSLQDNVKSDPFEDMVGSVKAGQNQAVKHDEVIYD